MEKLTHYREAIVNLLEQYVHSQPQNNIEEHLLTDFEHGHFQVLRSGWADKDTFRLGILIHIQLKQTGKVWILANWTEDDIAHELVKKGIASNDIVLGFQPEFIRPYSGYAVA